MGNVAAGTLFATVQSLAAGTAVIGTAAPVAAAAAAGVATAVGGATLMDNENKNED